MSPSVAPVYKLTYFNIKGLGEPIRLLLSYGNIKFEDVRITHEEWPKYRDSMPLRQMPILEIDGRVYHQCGAICRYLSKQMGLAGDNDLEALEIDMVIDNINDFVDNIVGNHYEQDEKIREERFPQLQAEVIPYYLKKLEAIAAANKGHMALGKLTWADIWFLGAADYLNWICRQDVLLDNPNLRAVKENTLAIPAIKSWYERSPKLDY